MSIRAAIFDWAGTTVDYGCMAPLAVFLEAFRRQGVEVTAAEARGPMGTFKRDHIRALTQVPRIAAEWQRVHGRPPAETDVDSMFADFVPMQLACLSKHADVIPGAVDTLAWLRERGIRTGGTTGYTREMMNIVEPIAAAQGYAPDVSLASDEAAAGRPFPWMLFRCLERLGACPVRDVVKVGDTVADIEEGLNAGVWTVGVVRTGNMLGLTHAEDLALNASERQRLLAEGTQKLRTAGAHEIIDGVSDLPTAIAALEMRRSRGEKP